MGLRCKFDSDLAFSGKCKEYFSLAENTPVYAKEPYDLFMCTDGFGTLDIVDGEQNMKVFVPGLYRCGKELTSNNAGEICSSYTDCGTNENGVYASCDCTYSGESQRCDILPSNSEY